VGEKGAGKRTASLAPFAEGCGAQQEAALAKVDGKVIATFLLFCSFL